MTGSKIQNVQEIIAGLKLDMQASPVHSITVISRSQFESLEAALSSSVASIVPEGCTASVLCIDGGSLHVNKDGSGYIIVDEKDFAVEDDRCEGPDGPEGSVHWIARFPAGDMTALRDFLNGQGFTELSAATAAESEQLARAFEAEANQLREVSIANRHRAEVAEAEVKRLRDIIKKNWTGHCWRPVSDNDALEIRAALTTGDTHGN